MDYRYLLGGNLLLDLEKEENFGKEVFLEEPLAYLADALQNHQKEQDTGEFGDHQTENHGE